MFNFRKKISIVIPAYNSALHISLALQSCLNQGVSSIEVIICDDSSTDNTCAIVQSFSDSRLALLRNDINQGPGPSRDRAIDVANGEWIALIDADDAWTSGRLERLLDAAAATGADVVFDDIRLCHDTERGLIPWRAIHGAKAFGGSEHLAQPRLVAIEDYVRSPRLVIQPLIRTSFIRQHNIRHSARRFAEDAEFILRLAHAGARFCYLPTPMYLYRITPGSLTAQAKDPALMRQVIEACAQWPGWSSAVLDAFKDKIAALAHSEQLYALRAAARQGKVGPMLSLLAASPGLALDAFQRLPGQLAYQWHRARHGGSGR